MTSVQRDHILKKTSAQQFEMPPNSASSCQLQQVQQKLQVAAVAVKSFHTKSEWNGIAFLGTHWGCWQVCQLCLTNLQNKDRSGQESSLSTLRCTSLFVYYWHVCSFMCVCVCVGLPALYRADGHVSPDEPPPCVLERLCELHDGLVVEAKGIKQHYFKPYIQKLYQKQVHVLSHMHISIQVCFLCFLKCPPFFHTHFIPIYTFLFCTWVFKMISNPDFDLCKPTNYFHLAVTVNSPWS